MASFAQVTTLTDSLAAISGGEIVDYLALSNTHTSAVAVTVQDGDGKTLMSAVSLDANTLTQISLPDGLLFRGGLYALADTADKVDLWVRFLG